MNCTRSSMGVLSRQGIAPPVLDSGKKCYPGRRTALATRSPDHTVQSSGFPVLGLGSGVACPILCLVSCVFCLVSRTPHPTCPTCPTRRSQYNARHGTEHNRLGGGGLRGLCGR